MAKSAPRASVIVHGARKCDVDGEANGFWVVFGTLAVLRSNALGTGATAVRALEQVRERCTHRDRIRVPGVVDQQASARQLRLLGAPARAASTPIRR